MATRTGGFRIGFRLGWDAWQKDRAALAAWAQEVGFDLIDLGKPSADEVKTVKAAGVDVVSVDRHDWSDLIDADAGKVLMRWQLDDGNYRVIFGDLHTETVNAQRLALLEDR